MSWLHPYISAIVGKPAATAARAQPGPAPRRTSQRAAARTRDRRGTSFTAPSYSGASADGRDGRQSRRDAIAMSSPAGAPSRTRRALAWLAPSVVAAALAPTVAGLIDAATDGALRIVVTAGFALALARC